MLFGSMGFGTALAQSEGLKIGYVDPERLLLSAPQTKVAMDTLNDEFAPRQRQLVAMESSLREKNETYERDREVMGQEERTSLERELREGQRDLQRANTEFQEDLNIRRNELLATAQRAVSEQIEVYASREGYDLILQNAVYHSPGLDITDSVLSFLNRNVLEGNRSEE
jgi:outer membrane protein